jgi:tungstate transport system ATP-binding protein
MSETIPGYALEATQLSVALGGQKVVDVPSLQVRKNEVLMIIGPNGSGKTTLLLTLASLIRPTAGGISYHEMTVDDRGSLVKLRRKLAVVFQDPLLLNRNVWENVTLGLRLRGIKGAEMKARTEKWLERFGVTHLAKRSGRTLSGGEAKRVSLARAMALEPTVLFLDEPFTALDTPTRQALLEDFERVLRETRVTTVMVTHDHNEALALGDRIAVLMKGSIRQLGTPQEVFSSPVDEEVAEFVEAGNIWCGVVTSQSGGLVSVDIDGRSIQAVSPLPAQAKVAAYLNYEDVTLVVGAQAAAPSTARNQMRGTITKSFPHGTQLKVTLDCGFPLSSVITRRSWEELELGVGREVVASFKASSVHLIPKV